MSASFQFQDPSALTFPDRISTSRLIAWLKPQSLYGYLHHFGTKKVMFVFSCFSG